MKSNQNDLADLFGPSVPSSTTQPQSSATPSVSLLDIQDPGPTSHQPVFDPTPLQPESHCIEPTPVVTSPPQDDLLSPSNEPQPHQDANDDSGEWTSSFQESTFSPEIQEQEPLPQEPIHEPNSSLDDTPYEENPSDSEEVEDASSEDVTASNPPLSPRQTGHLRSSSAFITPPSHPQEEEPTLVRNTSDSSILSEPATFTPHTINTNWNSLHTRNMQIKVRTPIRFASICTDDRATGS